MKWIELFRFGGFLEKPITLKSLKKDKPLSWYLALARVFPMDLDFVSILSNHFVPLDFARKYKHIYKQMNERQLWEICVESHRFQKFLNIINLKLPESWWNEKMQCYEGPPPGELEFFHYNEKGEKIDAVD